MGSGLEFCNSLIAKARRSEELQNSRSDPPRSKMKISGYDEIALTTHLQNDG